MPPSAVFSYWRRDHRRSSAPPVSLPAPTPGPKSTTESPISPPQLPVIPDTPTLTAPFDGLQSIDIPGWSDSPLENDASKLNFHTSAAPLSSSVSLAVPSPSDEKENRPHSSPGEHESELSFISPANNSLLSVSGLRHDQGDGEPTSKPTSPFRLSFGKGLRNLQASPFEPQRRSPTAGPGQSHFRLKTSPDETPADKMNMTQRDLRMEGLPPRRAGDRDLPAEHTHHKSGKAMLHLLNPMSLLARRRSSHMGISRVDEVKINAPNLIPAIPDDYDPRIRGNIVHDFSAPRPRRNVSGNTAAASDGSSSLNPRDNRWNDKAKRHSDHSPVFKEHFEDDRNVLQVENKGYLQSSLLTNPTQHGYEKSIPVFARNLPSYLPDQSPETVGQSASPPAELPAEVPVGIPAEVASCSPKASPPTHQHDQDTIPNVPQSSSGLPRHLKSNASRFSFDMGGVESSVQEKLLEEKHKAKEAQRKLEDGYFDDFDDEFDHDLLDDIDGLEEKIPGVNADADDDELSVPSIAKSWAIPGLSPVVASPIIPAPPEAPIYPVDTAPMALAEQSDTPHKDEAPQQEGTVIDEPRQVQLPPAANIGIVGANPEFPEATKQGPQIPNDDDDLYFDDGEFGDLTIDDQDADFDESVFDDETSHLYERKPAGPPPARQPSQSTIRSGDALEREFLLEEAASQGLKHMPSVASEYGVASIKRGPLGEPIPNMGPARAHGGVLTERNLEVLHNALAFAANEAATQGRFERTFSTSDRSLAHESISQASHTADSQPGLVSDDSRLSQGADMVRFDDFLEDQIYDDDDMYYDDDAYYDDPIVAAANAEALENDDEGFYGQEFGFYAQALGTCSGEMTNGGYFGPRGVEGITRNHSSRGKFQEPSLTPITERSEWSTRNSVISLKAHGGAHSNPSLSSPGLAQLVDLGNLDDEMSLSALLKLRRGAWGGSNGSLRSSAGSPPPHALSSPNRGSFIGASEVSPSEARPSADEGLAGMGYAPDDGHGYAVSPPNRLGSPGDPPLGGMDGPTYAEYLHQVPSIGTQQPPPPPNIL
ncbi:uncharacterized protein N7482_003817 [Penicillium canariense]|uniref:Uncharacterized protein n=1 Tax=Penicillium canariense TaxID=189055 RepID=A0A9W9I7I6_9EURO|nr:uncharacterized protein N7482_003817 [Penicillium canariense]KAJ5168223.1 hypothetical protein N7482_003817 [Penicillium canariense]